MKSNEEIKAVAKATLISEAKAIEKLVEIIDDDFVIAVNDILECNGRVVVTGIGKSAIIAQKIVATLNSTGTSSLFLHAAEAVHGDLGSIAKDDIVICISKSGDTPEIKVLLPLIRNFGNRIIAIVGNRDSYLATHSDLILDVTVVNEACPNNLAPTSSTTAQLAMGDALATALIVCRDFTAQDFARFHPGGTLGKRMYLHVSDVYVNNQKPLVGESTDMTGVILEISSKRLGVTAVVDKDEQLMGCITDGDLRRAIHKFGGRLDVKAVDIMTANPQVISPDTLLVEALDLMRTKNITSLCVVENRRYLGIIHLHDILREGII